MLVSLPALAVNAVSDSARADPGSALLQLLLSSEAPDAPDSARASPGSASLQLPQGHLGIYYPRLWFDPQATTLLRYVYR